MATATRVRPRTWVRQPVTAPHVTISPGGRQPTALAMAASGLLPRVAERMGRNFATLDKWSQGERGPEHDLDELFPALRRAGISRERAALIPARIQALFNAAYGDELPTLHALHAPETAAEAAENSTQMDCVLTDDDLDAQARYLPNVLLERSMLDTIAAVITRNLQAAGRL